MKKKNITSFSRNKRDVMPSSKRRIKNFGMKEASVKKDTEDQNKRRKIRIHFLKKTKLTGLIILP